MATLRSHGGAGADVITAGDGGALITGGTGNDVITGHAGVDTIAIAFGGEGVDTIATFTSGTDIIDFTGTSDVAGTTLTLTGSFYLQTQTISP